jgi:hypothetical protein
VVAVRLVLSVVHVPNWVRLGVHDNLKESVGNKGRPYICGLKIKEFVQKSTKKRKFGTKNPQN